jgi:hypothetical protein
MRLIQEHRVNDLPVEGTSPQELQKAKHMLREHDDENTRLLGKRGSPKITKRVAPASETKDAENPSIPPASSPSAHVAQGEGTLGPGR